jgi:hypothetical protein
MKKLFVILAATLMFSCIQPVGPIQQPDNVDQPVTEQPTNDQPTDPLLVNDPRLQLVDAASTKWLRLPRSSRGFASSDPVAAFCTEPGWSYIFYDDAAVIGYEPLPENTSIMHRAVAITVESRNMEFPDAKWDFINVPLPGPPPPDTSNDPELEPWQFALCLDDGSIVAGPYTAEFDFNWAAFKNGGAATELEVYNRDNYPHAHIVWGPEKE